MEFDLGPGAWERAGLPSSAAIVDIPDNRTLLIEKLTSEPEAKPKMVDGLENIDAVFDHFKPKVRVNFKDSEGAERKEGLAFKGIDNFGKKGIVKQSSFLQNLKRKQDNYMNFARILKSNKSLQKVLQDDELREAYILGLKAMLAELDSKT